MESQPVTLFPVPDDYGSIYDFFYQCEQDNVPVTIPLIRDRFFPGNYDAAHRHVNRFWRWFLMRVSNETIPYVFKVQGIIEYPRTYFINAHKPKHMQYFHHFVESMRAFDNRVKRAARPRRVSDQYDQQPLPLPLVIPEDDPLEELSEEEELQEKDVVEEPEERDISEEDATLPNQDAPPAKPDEDHGQSPPPKLNGDHTNEDHEQLPQRPSSHLFWYISCGVAAVVIGVIIAYILISKRE